MCNPRNWSWKKPEIFLFYSFLHICDLIQVMSMNDPQYRERVIMYGVLVRKKEIVD